MSLISERFWPSCFCGWFESRWCARGTWRLPAHRVPLRHHWTDTPLPLCPLTRVTRAKGPALTAELAMWTWFSSYKLLFHVNATPWCIHNPQTLTGDNRIVARQLFGKLSSNDDMGLLGLLQKLAVILHKTTTSTTNINDHNTRLFYSTGNKMYC